MCTSWFCITHAESIIQLFIGIIVSIQHSRLLDDILFELDPWIFDYLVSLFVSVSYRFTANSMYVASLLIRKYLDRTRPWRLTAVHIIVVIFNLYFLFAFKVLSTKWNTVKRHVLRRQCVFIFTQNYIKNSRSNFPCRFSGNLNEIVFCKMMWLFAMPAVWHVFFSAKWETIFLVLYRNFKPCHFTAMSLDFLPNSIFKKEKNATSVLFMITK